MNNSLHARALQLIAQRRIEDISSADSQWLASHLSECESCSSVEFQTAQALALFRSESIELPKNLASRTQMRVHLRAEDLREEGSSGKWIWLVAAVSWVLGLATAPWIWHGFDWIGQQTGAPRLLVQFGFVLWWGLPALLAAGIVLTQRWTGARELD